MKCKWGRVWPMVAAAVLAAAVLLAGCAGREPTAQTPRELKLATTTSTYDSGLLEEILPVFEERYGYKVSVISVGTGAALETGKRGDCDVLLVHAREQELQMVAEGHFVDRHDVMYNDFVLVGPAADPAGITGEGDVVAAFRRLAETGSMFVSRGDDSGTHKAEMKIWTQAGLEPRGAWYYSVGQGMGDTLRMAGELQGYTLADRGTWVSMKEGLNLKVVLEGDALLFNQYGVMAVNPANHPRADFDGAVKLIQFLVSEEGQALIGGFKKHGEQLFVPNASA